MSFKKLSKLSIVFSLVILTFLLSACGGSKAANYDGKWIAVSVEFMGTQGSPSSVFGEEFAFEISGSSVKLIPETSEKASWSEKDGKFILTVEDQSMEGIVGDNIITFEKFGGEDLKIIFAKEGTDAANPELYASETEKAFFGKWESEEALDATDQPATDLPVDVKGALKLELNSDYTGSINLFGEDIKAVNWSFFDDLGGSFTLEDANYTIMFDAPVDGKLKVYVSNSDLYYTFICTKVE